MTDRASELMQEALSLTEEERAELACSLIDSLDPALDEGAEAAWEQEIGPPHRRTGLRKGQNRPLERCPRPYLFQAAARMNKLAEKRRKKRNERMS